MSLHALTLWTPWDQAILFHRKRVENRTWRPPTWQIGELLALHAGKHWDRSSAEDIFMWTGSFYGSLGRSSGVVGVCRVVGYVAGEEPTALPKDQRRWYVGPVGWLLSEVTEIKPVIQINGRQGLWIVPPNIADEVLRQHHAAMKNGGVRW